MRLYIIAFCSWLIKLCGGKTLAFPYEIIDTDLVNFAKKLCDRAEERYKETSGEYKRDRVFEQILNTHPNIKPKYIHLAIILARML